MAIVVQHSQRGHLSVSTAPLLGLAASPATRLRFFLSYPAPAGLPTLRTRPSGRLSLWPLPQLGFSLFGFYSLLSYPSGPSTWAPSNVDTHNTRRGLKSRRRGLDFWTLHPSPGASSGAATWGLTRTFFSVEEYCVEYCASIV